MSKSYNKNAPRNFRGRYASGTLVPIPEWLPSALRKFRRETFMPPSAIAQQVPKDLKGVRVSAHAVSNLMNNDVGAVKLQKRVGATLLGHLTTIIKTHPGPEGVAVERDHVEIPEMLVRARNISENLKDLNDTLNSGSFGADTQEMEFTEERRGKVLNVSELVTLYATLADADRAIVTALVDRLQPVPEPEDPRVGAIEALLDVAAKLEHEISPKA